MVRRCILFAGSITEYRIVQRTDGRITVYADICESMKQRVQEEFERLAEEKYFRLPEISFVPYCYDKTRKLKRVERLNTRSEENEKG